MSLIADALRTAQRERLRRQSREIGDNAAPSAASAPRASSRVSQGLTGLSTFLVPLKAAQPRFRWEQALGLGLGLAVIAAAGWLMIGRVRATSARSLTPIGSAPLAAASRIDSVVAPAGAAAAATKPDPAPVRPPQARAPERAPAAVTVPRRVALAPTLRDTSARLQGQPRADSVVAVSARPVAPTGRLRIAVDRMRDAEATAIFGRAVAAHRAGDLTSARADYERVLTIAPRDLDALSNLGVLLSALREFDRAEQVLRRAISIAPRNAAVWHNLGTVLRERGGGPSNAATAAFQQALSIEPGHQGARVGLAQQYLSLGSLTQARQLLEEVLAVNPSIPEAHYTLGQVLELQGDRPGAIASYQSFIRVAPSRFSSVVERVRGHIDTLSRAP